MKNLITAFFLALFAWAMLGPCMAYKLGFAAADKYWQDPAHRFQGLRSCDGSFDSVQAAGDAAMAHGGGTIFNAPCGGYRIFMEPAAPGTKLSDITSGVSDLYVNKAGILTTGPKAKAKKP